MPDVAYPGDERYESCRSQFIGRPAEVLPRAVALCEGASDVVEALAWARAEGWPFAVRGGGHSNAGYSSTSGLLIALSPGGAVEVAGSSVTVGAGVRVGAVAAALGSRVLPAGSCPSVGVVGAALGGGFGSHGRLHGLTCDSLAGAEVVLAGGEVVHTDDEPELLWALRGAGGGNFGVVTRATFRTYEAGPRVHFRLEWPFERAAELIRWWQGWAPFAEDAMSAELVLLCPQYPEEDPVVLLVGAGPGVPECPEPAVAEVVEVSAEDAGVLHATPYSAVSRDPTSIPLVSERPGMSTAKTGFFGRPLPEEAVAELLGHFVARRAMGELREVSFTPWGGAYARAENGAFAHRAAMFLVKHTVLVGPGGAARRADEVLNWLATSWNILHPWGTGGVYPNFPDPDLQDWLTAYYGDHVERLRAAKRRYDPRNVFRFAQSIPP
ncbi:FAD-binding oxidoreductase [Saccharothrix sp. NPDC042600]|uniref:FAD-binding oxidoreductase n=1 Tax=Saccharothrix TaxID=2071 RepID=UPI0000F0828D